MIDRIIEYFEANKETLLAEYGNRVVVISNDFTVTPFDNLESGYSFGLKTYGYGNFLLKECSRTAIDAVHIISPVIAIA